MDVRLKKTLRKRGLEEQLNLHAEHLEELVSERTRELAESERSFRGLADLLPEFVFETDLGRNFIFISRTGLQETGYADDDLRQGLNVSQLVMPEDRDRAVERIQAILAGDRSQRQEYRLRRKDGTAFPAIVDAIPVIRDGKPIGLRGIAIDITERKRMEEELSSVREQSDYLIKSNPAVIYSGKPSADLSDWYLTYLSDRVRSMLGFEPADFVGHPEFWGDRVHPEDRPAIVAGVTRLWKEGEFEFEYRFLHKDGNYRWIREETKVVRDVDGKPIEVHGYWTDVTERKNLEQIGDRLIVAATHELRTPLGPLKVHIDYALAGKLGPVPENLRSSLQAMKASTDRLVELTEQLLDIRRLQSGRFKMDLHAVDLREVIDQSIEETQIYFDGKKQHLRTELPDKPLPVRGDSIRLIQVLTNLLSNASKFSPENGRITIRVHEAEDIQVSVSDTGIGIRTEDLPMVFQPFSAIRKPTWMKGAGLGLSIAKGMVEDHGGKMWVESDGEGKGATFMFTLPKLKEEG